MQKYEIKVLSNDKRIYEVTDFVAAGKNHEDAIGIVFGTPIIGWRVLAFDSWVGPWGKTDRILTESHNVSQAVQILCGLEDTRRIVEAQSQLDEMTAAKWCWNYKKGDLQWYMPSLMEDGALFLVCDQANDAMKQLGCNSDCLLPTKDSDKTCVWSSSENSHYYSWSVYFSNGNFISINKGDSKVVRAVATISQLPSPNLFSGKAKSKGSEMSDAEIKALLRSRGYTGTLTKTLRV